MDSLSDSKAVKLAELCFMYCDDCKSEDASSEPISMSVREMLEDLAMSCNFEESIKIEELIDRIDSL